MRVLAIVMLVLLASACAGGSGGSVQGSGGDRSSQGHVGWRLPL